MINLQYPIDKTTIDKFFNLNNELKTIDRQTIIHESNAGLFIIFSALFLFFTFLIGSILTSFTLYGLFILEGVQKFFLGLFGAATLGFFGSAFYQNKKYQKTIKLKFQKEAQIKHLVNEFYREENMQLLFQFFNERQETYQSVFTQGTLQKAMEEMFAASKQDSFEYKQHCLTTLLNLVLQENGYKNELNNSKEFKEKFKLTPPPTTPSSMISKEIKAIEILRPQVSDLAPQYSYMK